MPSARQKPPMKKLDPRIPAGVYGPEQPFRKHDRDTEEMTRLRRLADVRSVLGHNMAKKHGSSTNSVSPLPIKPPLPQVSPSTPNLHDFATRTHLARLDIAYEKLDTYVEQSVEQLRSAMDQKLKGLEDWVQQKVGTSEEKLASALTTVQQTRSVLDSAVSSLSTAKGGMSAGTNAVIDAELRARIASCEERLVASICTCSQTRERLASIENQLAVEKLEASAPNVDSPKAEARLQALEEKFKERLQSHAVLEEKLASVSSNADDCRAALEKAIGDVARNSSDHSVLKDMQSRIFDARTESLQAAVSEMAAQLEAVRAEKNSPLNEHGVETEKAAVDESLRALWDRLAALQLQVSATEAVAQKALTCTEEDLSREEIEEKLLAQEDALERRTSSLQAHVDEKVSSLESKISDGLQAAQENVSAIASQAHVDEKVSALECKINDALQAAQIDEKVSAIESQVNEKTNGEVQDLKWRQESFATNLDNLARRVQGMLDKNGAIESQLQELQTSQDDLRYEMNRPPLSPIERKTETSVAEDVKEALVDLFQSSQDNGNVAGLPLLASGPRIEALEEKLGGTVSDLSDVVKRISGLVSHQDFFMLRARVDGGFQALLGRIEASRYVMEQEDQASDHIFQLFMLNLDERIRTIESHLHKNDHLLEKLMERSHLKYKKLHVPAHCPQCRARNGPDEEVCAQCGFQRAAQKVEQRHALNEQHRQHKDISLKKKEVVGTKNQQRKVRLLNVVFDVWARGEKAMVLQSYRVAHGMSPVKGMRGSTNQLSPAATDELSRRSRLSPAATGELSRRSRSWSPAKASAREFPTPIDGAAQMRDARTGSKSLPSESPRRVLFDEESSAPPPRRSFFTSLAHRVSPKNG